MWNNNIARQIETWYNTPQGAFVLDKQHKLVQMLLSGWPRRNRTLLCMGCESLWLEMLWHQGFDTSGFDCVPENLEMAAKHLGHRADFYLGQFDHLPFDDNSFDYAVLFSVLEHVDDPLPLLREALRVSAKGILLGFFNSCSLYHADNLQPGINPFRIFRMLNKEAPECRITARSILLGPRCTWKEKRLYHWINGLPLPFPIGACMGLHVDLEPRVPLTPLLLQARQKALSVYAHLQPETVAGTTYKYQKNSVSPKLPNKP